MNKSGKKLSLACITAATLAACSTVPERNPVVEQAEAKVEAAASDPQVVEHAPDKLEEAQRDLNQAKLLWEKNQNRATIEHYSYLAEKKAMTARALADHEVAKEQIEAASTERDRILYEARSRQLVLAQTQAELSAEAAAMARREAELARMEAASKSAELKQKSAELQQLREMVSELQAKQTERGLVLTLGDVLFDLDKADLKAGGMKSVEKLAAFLKEYPERKVLIEGFTDSTGAEDYNQRLSERRAGSVRDALLAQGIDQSRIQIRGYGEAFPVATNNTSAGRQQNRRVEVIISDQSGVIPARTQ